MKKILFATFLMLNIVASSTYATLLGERKNCLADMHENFQDITESLNLEYCGLNDADLLKVVGYVTKHPIKGLYLAGNNISAEGAKLIAQLPKIENLDLSANHIGTIGAKVLAKKAYNYLGVNANEIGKTGIMALADSKNKYIDLGNNNLDSDDILYLLKNKNLTFLNLEKASITPQAVDALAHNSRIEVLDLSYTNLSAEQIEQIIANKRLGKLSLKGMNLYSIKGLKNQTDLRTLILAENRYGIYDMGELSVIFNLPKLVLLDLSENNITSDVIIDPLNKLNHYFIGLDLSGNKIDDAAINTIISKHSLIGQQLSILRNHFSQEGIAKLVDEYGYDNVFKHDMLKAPASATILK